MNMEKFNANNWSNLSLDQKKDTLQDAFKQENWKNLDENQRLAIANCLEDYNAKTLERPPVKVGFDGVPKGFDGGYSAKTNSINFNKEFFVNGDEVTKYRLIELTFHEGKHAFQRYSVLNIDKFSQDKKEEINKWKENEYSYFSKDPLYERQAIEKDAYAYGETKANDFFNCEKLKSEAVTKYKDFRDERNKHDKDYIVEIEKELGKDYSKKVDAMVKINYLGQEYNKLLDQLGDNKIPEKQEQQVSQLANECNSLLGLYKRTVDQMDGKLVQGQTMIQMNDEELQKIENQLRQKEQELNNLAKDLHINNITPDNSRIIYGRAITDMSLTHSSEKHQDINPTPIGDLRKTLNDQVNEINMQLTELSQQRDQVIGAPLTKEQAEKLAASNYLNGADKQLDQQALELQAKRDKLSQFEKETMKFGKENGLDTTLWRHAPEIFKGEGLKNYESSMAAIENNHKFYNGQETAIQTKREQLQERLQTPEAKSEIAKQREEHLVQDKERIAKLEILDRKLNQLQNEKNEIIKLKDVIPTRNREKEISLQGDTKDVQNILKQTDQITLQVADMKQEMVQSRGLGRSR